MAKPKTNKQPTSGLGLYPKYFVLKPRGESVYAAASRRAMRQYARDIQRENPTLASELREWADREWMATETAQKAGQALVDAEERR